MYLPWHFHVCTYHQSEAISQSLWAFCRFGLVLTEHDNRYHTPHNRMPFADVQAMLQFLENLATTHATPLHMQHHYQGIFLSIKIRLSCCSLTRQKDLYTISVLGHVLMTVSHISVGPSLLSLVGASPWHQSNNLALTFVLSVNKMLSNS